MNRTGSTFAGRRWIRGSLVVLAVVLPSVPFLTAPAYAVEPIGGCWVSYDGIPQRDISSKLAPWADEDAAPKGPADHSITLSPQAPPANSQAKITYTYNKGPANAGPPAQVSGTFVFSVNGGSEVSKTVDYGTISTGQTIPGKTFKLPFTVQQGENVVVFEGVTFDASPFQVKITCNGQSSATPKENPRSAPKPTNVTASLTSKGTAAPQVPDPTDPNALTSVLCTLPVLGGSAVCQALQGPGSDPGDEPGDDPGDEPSQAPTEGNDPDETGDDESPDGPGPDGQVVGTPAAGKVVFDCVLQPFDTHFDYEPAASVSGARPSAGSPVGLLARFGDLPGIAPVPIDGRMDVTATLTVAGKAVTVKGSRDVKAAPESPVPVPDLTGSVAADEDELSVSVDSFAFNFPSYSIDASCTPTSGSDLGTMTVGAGSAPGGGTSSPSDGVADSLADPGAVPDGTAPPTTPAGAVDAAVSSASQSLSIVDVRVEGTRGLGELFGAAPRRTLILIVQNVGAETIAEPVVSVGMGSSETVAAASTRIAVGPLAPQQMQRIELPVEMSLANIGPVYFVGQVGTTSAGTFRTSTQTLPWGLFALNLLALAIGVWGLRRRLNGRRRLVGGVPGTRSGRPACGRAR